MATMRAVLKTGAESAEIIEVPRPEPGPGDVLVRVHACAICASDLSGWKSPEIGDRTRPGWNPSYPGMTGHELSGTIAAVGEGVSTSREGEAVWIDPINGCGDCDACRAQRFNLCPHARALSNGYADYVVSPSSHALPIPRGCDINVASMISDMLGTPMGAAKRAELQGGETVAVWGLGPVGLGLVQAARIRGAGRIVGVDLYPNRRKLALKLGATEVIDPTDTDPVAEVRAQTDGRGADVVLHTVAAPEPTRQAFEALRLEGRMVTVAGFPPAGGQVPKTVTGNWVCYHADFPEFLAHLESGAFQLAPYVTHTFPLERVEEAFSVRLHRPQESLKVIVEMV